eukprot:CAMPEP_0114408604 /NCGR_PEP_ID=MMETSP0102-20121206/22835_1 /TAXON_ID=38822 ORGANISM="Pteridomonas danica, Strain PT" /NCGR_SAMPLE_ID=MMETSP0102 /ASSEMBLY_ACC=CAM_ASM_000212 /LENGTH=30 /DNA_ID= /DNA_START= /DNA_END= /DNA_ORIENTATION=
MNHNQPTHEPTHHQTYPIDSSSVAHDNDEP